jgi:hypothetical protein
LAVAAQRLRNAEVESVGDEGVTYGNFGKVRKVLTKETKIF